MNILANGIDFATGVLPKVNRTTRSPVFAGAEGPTYQEKIVLGLQKALGSTLPEYREAKAEWDSKSLWYRILHEPEKPKVPKVNVKDLQQALADLYPGEYDSPLRVREDVIHTMQSTGWVQRSGVPEMSEKPFDFSQAFLTPKGMAALDELKEKGLNA